MKYLRDYPLLRSRAFQDKEKKTDKEEKKERIL
jgi:hypothetical protein